MRRAALVLLLPLAVFAADSRRPYEMVEAGRVQDEHSPLVALTAADGWTVLADSAEATFVRATDRLLFGDGVARLAYRATGRDPVVELVPPSPLAVPDGCDAMSVWCYGNNIFGRDPSTPSTVLAVRFRTPDGQRVDVSFDPIVHKEWHLLHRRFPRGAAEALAKGATIEALRQRGGRRATGQDLVRADAAARKGAADRADRFSGGCEYADGTEPGGSRRG